MTRRIAFYLYPEYQMLDLSGPLCAFQTANHLAKEQAYVWLLLSSQGGAITNSVGLSIETKKAGRRSLDTLIVVGGNIAKAVAPSEIAAIRGQAQTCRRLASVCTGAFALAQANMLDGKKATTHWRFGARLQKDYPQAIVTGDAIYVKDGNIWTSAGITAGMDLALALIQEDLGLELARSVAQEMVVYHRRPGGQSQFSALAQLAPESERMQLLVGYIRKHLTEDLSLEKLARAAHLSVRQFGRAFKVETGETPAKAVERIRAEVAHSLLEETSEPVEAVAEEVGFSDPERMRRAFLRLFGIPPQGVRRNARADRGRGTLCR